MLRQMDAEARLERQRQESERRQTEQRQELAEAKAEIREQRRQKAAARQAFLDEQTAEIRRRAAEQQELRARRQAEQEEAHDRIMAGLKPCRAYNDDGSPCTRKANPGLSYCYLHVGYSGPLQEQPRQSLPVADGPQDGSVAAHGQAQMKENSSPGAATVATDIPSIGVQTATSRTSGFEAEYGHELFAIVVIVLAALAAACLVAVFGMGFVGFRLAARV